jgi:hypothetical protein
MPGRLAPEYAPFPSRDGEWAIAFTKAGHIVLLPGSFGSRSLGSQCGTKDRKVTSWGLRRDRCRAMADTKTH